MNKYSILSSNIKRGLIRFCEKISKGLSRPTFKFVSQMLYGIMSAQSCHISKIARSLEEKTRLKKTIDRLLRNLNEFDDGEVLFENYMDGVKGIISEKTILLVDPSDITKPCSPKMEHIGKVWDGSKSEYGQGYFTLGVTALTPERKMPVSVYTRVYSAAEPEFVSTDEEILKALRFLGTHFKKNNIRVFDRGFDANVYYEHLIDRHERFVIRSKKNRDVIYKGERVNIMKLAKRFKGKYCLKFHKRNGVTADCKISIVPVRLPCRPDVELNLVVCNGLGQEPLLLITDMKSEDKRLSVVVTKVYLLRWRIDEFYGFKKQQLGFEGFRVRSLKSIRNLDLFVTIAGGWIGILSEKSDERRTVMELIHISRRIFDVPNFVFYAIADGWHTIVSKSCGGIYDMLRKTSKPIQLSLFPVPGFDCAF